MKSRLAPVALLALLGAPAAARAEPPPRITLRLDYTRGPSTACLDEHALREVLSGSADYEARADAEYRFVIAATRRLGEHHVDAVFTDGEGKVMWKRHYHDPSCTEALLNVATSTGLELDALQRRLAPSPTAPAPAPLVAPMPLVIAPPAPLPVMIEPPPPVHPSLELDVGIDAVLAMGSTPNPTLGAGVFVGVRPALLPAFSVEVTGRASSSVTAAQQGHVSVSSAFYSGQLALCGHVRAAFLCPMVGVGQVDFHHALSVGVDALRLDTTPTHPLALFGARAGVEHRTAHFGLRAYLEIEGLPGGAKFAFHNYEQWRASYGVVVGVGVTLPPL